MANSLLTAHRSHGYDTHLEQRACAYQITLKCDHVTLPSQSPHVQITHPDFQHRLHLGLHACVRKAIHEGVHVSMAIPGVVMHIQDARC